MNGFRLNQGEKSNEIKYPANCATRISMEPNVAASVASGDMDMSVLDKLYEPKHNKKLFRVITVIAYIFSVSMVAILLSLYYLFLWDPYINAHKEKMAQLAKLQREQKYVDPMVEQPVTNLPPLDNFFDPPDPLALRSSADKPVEEEIPHLEWVTLTTDQESSKIQSNPYSTWLEDPFTAYYANAIRAKESPVTTSVKKKKKNSSKDVSDKN